jgi:hypothetical protein
MGYVISFAARILPEAALYPSQGDILINDLTEDEESESTPPSSPPAPALRRGKFDDEEEDSDVCQPNTPTIHLPTHSKSRHTDLSDIGSRILGRC